MIYLYKELKNITWFESEGSKHSKTRCQIWCSGLSPKLRKVLEKVIWLTSVGRNALVVIVCALIAYGCDPELPDVNGETKNTTFILTGNLESGIPKFKLPPFSINNTDTGEVTDLGGMLSELGSSIIIIPLMAVLENIAIAKAFGTKTISSSQFPVQTV